MVAVEESGTNSLVRDRAVRLFTYLKELTELRGDVKRNCDDYDQVIWWAEIPREKECYCAAWDLGREPAYDDWIRVERPRRKRPPSPPPALSPWLNDRDISDASQDAPPLKDSIVEELASNQTERQEPETVVRRLDECPTVRRQWELYVENHWWPWALEERRLQPVQSIYNELFAAYQNQERLGEAYEVVVGTGLLTWRPPHGPEIKRHIAVARAAIEFDSKTGVITVGLPADGARLSLEQDMLEPQDRPLPDVQNHIQNELSEIGDGLWAGPGLPPALNAYFQQLSPESAMDLAFEPQNGSADRARPQMNFAPALIVRQRSDRNLVRIFSEIAAQIAEGGTIPVGVEKLVSILDDHDAFDAESESTSAGGEAEDTYFPLPSNEAQRQIAQRLASRQGILVQGPPGTGKSHTITNLICHLLATGKRLLVTSHTARALRVLKKYFPPEFSPLCVSLLGDDTAALRDLEESVQGILGELNQWDGAKQQARMRQLGADIDRSRRELAEAYSKLKAIRASETEAVDLRFGDYSGTPQSLAVRVSAAAGTYDWMDINGESVDEPPLANSEAVELLHLWREFGGDRDEDYRRLLPELAGIPTPASFEQIVAKERELSSHLHSANASGGPALRVLSSVPVETRCALESSLRDFVALLDRLLSESEEWVKSAVQEVVRGKHHAWQNLSITTTSKLSFLKERVEKVVQLKISGIDRRDRAEVRVHAEILREHLLAGKSTGVSLRYNPFAPKLLKASLYLIDEVRINGRACERHTEATALLEYLDVIDALEHIDEQWSPFLKPPALPPLLRFSDQLRRAELLASVLVLKGKAETLNAMIARYLPDLQPLALHERQAVASFLNLFAVANIQDELKEVQETISAVVAELRSLRRDPHSHSLVAELLAAIENRDLDRYSRTHEAITCAWELRARQQRRVALETKLRRPELRAKAQTSLEDAAWDIRMSEFVAAWNWSRARSWLARRHADMDIESSLRQQIDLAQQRIRHSLKELGACKAWEFVLARLKPEQREHLIAWRLAVKKIGKGTGKYAGQYRKEARYHLEHCRSAIPGWVMPIFRVAETTKPAPNLFDVAIIDEASQSGPEALFLQYIARKIVVVGDDQQISPESVGLDRAAVDALRQRHIRDLPHWDAMGVDNSFFDQAQIRFAGRIRLREHFRCMPEIIQFSNNLCYQGEPLVPLRQYGSGRLTPVVTRHVHDGYAKGTGDRVINQPEADAIVDQITKCLADPAYELNERGEPMTFGVISLQGNAQANRIRDLLMERIGVQKMQSRGLVCGNAYAFQGDERDVIFLSMVSASNDGRHIGVLSKESDKRRFNVAASRARDQMWLFHSVIIEDLSSLCLRRQLLEYCLNPTVQTQTVEGIDVAKLRRQALEARHRDSRPPLPFDSWFEIDVFLQIVDRGLRVIPQYELAGKRIDLLIEGMQGRLAVECDGDQWHGLEEWDRDVDRQRMLERCGLRFWRVRGSAYYRDPAAALEPLWRVLEHDGISCGSFRNVAAAPSIAASSVELDAGEDIDGEESQEREVEINVDSAFESAKDEEQAPLFPATQESPLVLAPYEQWRPRPVPDPHSASLPELIDVLIEIVSAEGPIVCRRVYSLYNKAAGNARLGKQIVHVLNRAIYRAVKLGRLAQNDEQKRGGQINQVVRLTGSPAVSARERGPRSLEDIPALEIAAVRDTLLRDDPEMGEEQLLRQIAAVYRIVRKTPQVRKMLLG